MNELINKETMKLIEQHRFPTYNEIPNVGLYLEQVSKYINEYIEPLMDTSVTGSMISNYVKKKMIPNPVKKQYYRDHIAMLIIIAVLKSVVSLDKVGALVHMERDDDMENSYTFFCESFSNALKKVFGFENVSAEDKEKQLLNSIIDAVAHKIYIDKLLASIETD